MPNFKQYAETLRPVFWVRGSGAEPFANIGSNPVEFNSGLGSLPPIIPDGPLGAGQETGSMDFDGNQWVRYGTGAVDLGNRKAFTVLAWIKQKENGWSGERTIVDSGPGSLLLRTYDGNPHIAKAQKDGGYFGPIDLPGFDENNNPLLLDNQFHMVGAKGSDDPEVKRYSLLDGSVLSPVSIPGSPNLELFDVPESPITIGGNIIDSTNLNFVTVRANMQIAEVIHFDREISESELSKLYLASTGTDVSFDPITFPELNHTKTNKSLLFSWGKAWGGSHSGEIVLSIQYRESSQSQWIDVVGSDIESLKAATDYDVRFKAVVGGNTEYSNHTVFSTRPNMILSTNIPQPSYYTDGFMFSDAMMQRTGWQAVNLGGGSPLPAAPEGTWPNLDENLYPIGLTELNAIGMGVVCRPYQENGHNYPTGNYTFTFEGIGTVAVYNSNDNTRLEFSTNGPHVIPIATRDEGIRVMILSSDESNHVRNIKLIAPGTSGTFHDVFLEKLNPFKILRFMDAGGINGSAASVWSDRVLPGQTQISLYVPSKGAMSYEYMVELCNTTGKDGWFCIPHLADDNYITSLAEYVRDNLAPGLMAYVEYSNEWWNDGFGQYHYLKNIEGEGNEWKWGAFHTKRTFDAWKLGFGTRQFKRVAASQDAYQGRVVELLDRLEGMEGDGNYDVISTAPYFGGSFHNDWISAGRPSDVTAFFATYWQAEIERVLTSFYPNLRDERTISLGRNIELIAYEGGQHLPAKNDTVDELDPAFNDMHNSQEMGDAYEFYINRMNDIGWDGFTIYTLFGRNSKHGAWGAVQKLNAPVEDSPKYVSMLNYNDTYFGDPVSATGIEFIGPEYGEYGVPLTISIRLLPIGSVASETISIEIDDGASFGLVSPQVVTWQEGEGNTLTSEYTGAEVEDAGDIRSITGTVLTGSVSGPEPIQINYGEAPPSTVTSVSINPSEISVSGGGTYQFTAQVLGTGNPSQAVVWECPQSPITSSGLLTVPGAAAEEQPIEISATSIQDPTKSGSALLTVLAETGEPEPIAPDAATFTGPISGDVSEESTPFTITLNRSALAGGVSINLASNGSGDTFRDGPGGSPVTSISIPQGSNVGTFSIVPGASEGIRTITPTSTGIAFTPATRTYTATSETQEPSGDCGAELDERGSTAEWVGDITDRMDIIQDDIDTISATLEAIATFLNGKLDRKTSEVQLHATGLERIEVENGINIRQAMSPILAASAGVLSGANAGVIAIKGGNNNITRITATTDEYGNRESVILVLPPSLI